MSGPGSGSAGRAGNVPLPPHPSRSQNRDSRVETAHPKVFKRRRRGRSATRRTSGWRTKGHGVRCSSALLHDCGLQISEIASFPWAHTAARPHTAHQDSQKADYLWSKDREPEGATYCTGNIELQQQQQQQQQEGQTASFRCKHVCNWPRIKVATFAGGRLVVRPALPSLQPHFVAFSVV